MVFFFFDTEKKFRPQKQSDDRQKKKSSIFPRRHRNVHAFSNIPFLHSCHGAQTGHGTPERHHNLKKPNGRATFVPPKTIPTWSEKKNIFFFE